MSLLCAQDFARPDEIPGPLGQQRAAFLSQYLWPPLSTIRIYFFPLPAESELAKMRWTTPDLPPARSNYNPNDFLDPLYQTIQNKVDPITLIKTVVEERIAPLIGLTFTYTDNIDEGNIRIIFGPQYGCSSIVGNTRFMRASEKRSPTMYFGWFDVATVIHEFCHALGMIHEHQNPRENPIQFDREAIYCYFRYTQGWDIDKINANVINTYELNQTNGSKYDSDSIMIYSFPASVPCKLCEPFNDNNSEQCMERTLQTTVNNIAIKPKYKMSPTDIKWLGIMYPKDGKRDFSLIGKIGDEVTDIPDAPDWLDTESANQWLTKVADFFKTQRTLAIVIAVALGLFILYWNFVR